MKGRREAINKLIEAAILDADKKGVKVLSLGLLNQASKKLKLIILRCKINKI